MGDDTMGRTPVTAAGATVRIDALRAQIRGSVFTSEDVGYDDARRVFNAAVDQRPTSIVQVAGAADVATALSFAAEHELSVSVRGGGHGVAGRAMAGELVIDLAALRGVAVDAQARTAIVRGGTRWGEVDAATRAHELAVPGGRITGLGVGGLALGGGEGWLSAKHGRTSDNLLSAELVTADGRVVQVTADRHADLFQALRGGGGNFGVVTSFTFRLHDVPQLVLGGTLLYSRRDAADVLGRLADLRSLGRSEFSPAAVFTRAPAARFVPGDVVGQPVLAVIPAWLGDSADGERHVTTLRNVAQPLADCVGPMPYAELQASLDDRLPAGLRLHWTSTHIGSVTPGVVTELADAAASFPGRRTHIVLVPIGNAAQNDSVSWGVHVIAQWSSRGHDLRHLNWSTELVSRLRALGRPTARPERTTRRLRAVKAIWDPDDVFRHCDNHVTPLVEGAPR
jgi:hypothetical protein